MAIVSPPRRKTKRPSDRHFEKGSITIRSLTVSSTRALTPLVSARGRSFFTEPSRFRMACSLVRTVGTSRLCIWKITWAPRMMGTARSSITMIRALAFRVSGGRADGKQRMFPIERRIISVSVTSNWTVSPAIPTASRRGSSAPSDGGCRCSSLETFTMSPTGKTTNESPTSTKPWMTRPRVTIPFPSAKTSVTMNRGGFSTCRLAGKKLFTASNNVGPLYHWESCGLVRVLTFSPAKPEIGTNCIRLGLNSCCSKKSFTWLWIDS
mmetsp:Transcript_6325/g.18027  ORF Transcript_6325/g.18027 Transcript_6325/m.18027 type:complete len:266 (-) Transcript_6325:1297-2094(-)